MPPLTLYTQRSLPSLLLQTLIQLPLQSLIQLPLQLPLQLFLPLQSLIQLPLQSLIQLPLQLLLIKGARGRRAPDSLPVALRFMAAAVAICQIRIDFIQMGAMFVILALLNYLMKCC